VAAEAPNPNKLQRPTGPLIVLWILQGKIHSSDGGPGVFGDGPIGAGASFRNQQQACPHNLMYLWGMA
jgi:hypothetical protein